MFLTAALGKQAGVSYIDCCLILTHYLKYDCCSSTKLQCSRAGEEGRSIFVQALSYPFAYGSISSTCLSELWWRWVIQCGEQRVHAYLDVPALPSSEAQRFMDTQAEARWASSSLSLGTEARGQVGRLSSYLAQFLAKKKRWSNSTVLDTGILWKRERHDFSGAPSWRQYRVLFHFWILCFSKRNFCQFYFKTDMAASLHCHLWWLLITNGALSKEQKTEGQPVAWWHGLMMLLSL